MDSESPPGRLPKQVWQLGWISYFADVCSEMAYPILPLFLTAIGASAAALGTVEGVAESIVSFMKGASGVHSDISGKRVPYVQAGYGLTALGKPIIGLARSWPLVLIARSLDRFGKGLRTTARDTLITDAANKEQLGAAFGLHRALDTAGAFTGVVITLLIVHFFNSNDNVSLYRTIFLISFVPGLCSVALTMVLKESRHEDGSPVAEKYRLKLSELPKPYWTAVGLTMVFALANSSDTFLLLRGKNLGLSDQLVILAYAVYNVSYTLLSYPAGKLSDRIGRWQVLGAGWLIYAGAYAGFAVTGKAGLWPLFLIYGVYMGMTDGVGKALVASFAPAKGRGTALGFFYMLSGFATLLASLIAGRLWDVYGPPATFWFGAAMALIAVILVPFFVVGRRQPKGV